MQLMIDIAGETPETLRLAAQLLLDHASLMERSQPSLPQPSLPQASVPPVPPPIVPPVPAIVPTGTADNDDDEPPSNVLPFTPPVPPVPPVVPPVPTPTANASGTVGAQPLGGFELDASGMPWDARIHQKSKGKKRDGTWKLQREIDPALVSQVTQELHALMINSPGREVPAVPSFPGAVPVPPAPPVVPIPTANTGTPAPTVPVPPVPTVGAVPTPPVTVPPVPVPAAASVGVPDANNGGVVQMGFRELVKKISDLKAADKLTKEDVTSIVLQAGVPSLQALVSMPMKIADVNALVDATLATK